MIKILDWALWKLGWHGKYRRLKCKLGLHKYRYAMVYIGTSWVHADKECEYCKCGSVDIHRVRMVVGEAYQRGKDTAETGFIAYGSGVEKIVKVYDKKYVQNILDKIQ